MAIFAKLTWPIVDVEAVCASQDIGAAGALSLNGTLFNSNVPNQVSFISDDSNSNPFIRSVSITSTNNLSGRNLVINGFQNNSPITESIVGPNNTTVYGTKYYDIITDVTIDGAGNGIQVGTGDAGYLPIIAVNALNSFVNFSVSITLPAGSGINYSLFKTLDQITTNFISYPDQEIELFPAFGLTNETTSQIASSTNMTNFILLKVNSSATPITDTFDFIYLQS